jgi:hypothetical protein
MLQSERKRILANFLAYLSSKTLFEFRVHYMYLTSERRTYFESTVFCDYRHVVA